MVFTTWLLLACTAADLSISIPPRGREGITQEDLQRDLYLAQNETNENWLIRRMEQMELQLYQDPKGLCFGSKNKKRIVIVQGDTLESSLGKAVLISLGKAMHKTQQIFDLCMYSSPPQDKEWWLQDLSGGNFVFEETRVFTRVPKKNVPAMDFRELRSEVKELAYSLGIP